MTTIILVAGGVIVTLIIWLIVRTVRLTTATAATLRGKIEPALAPLREGRTPSPDQIQQLAASTDTRSVLHRALRDLDRGDLFPPQFASPEALAESDLVVWLMHGNELGTRPDAIELVKTVDRQSDDPARNGQYFVFRFRTLAPHWAAASGWMAGVAGPYSEGEEPFGDPTPRVFSKFESFDARSPEDHVEAMQRLARRSEA